LPPIAGHTDRRTGRYVVGADSKFNAFDSDWKWNAYYQKGISYQHAQVVNALFTPNYYSAVNAVSGPNGQIICNPALQAGAMAGSVPYTVLGRGGTSKAAINYVQGSGALDFRPEKFSQDVIDAQVTGTPFSDWAGPVSLAFGATYRHEHVNGIDDPGSAGGH